MGVPTRVLGEGSTASTANNQARRTILASPIARPYSRYPTSLIAGMG